MLHVSNTCPGGRYPCPVYGSTSCFRYQRVYETACVYTACYCCSHYHEHQVGIWGQLDTICVLGISAVHTYVPGNKCWRCSFCDNLVCT